MRNMAYFFLAFLVLKTSSLLAFEPLFDARIDYGAGNKPWSVFAADLDGDGDSDLAVANWDSNNISILKNNGDGTYQAAVNYATGNHPSSVFAADLDGDGDSDLAVANNISHNVSILKNNGDGTYQAAVNYGVGDYPQSIFAADLDGDGDSDLAVANRYSDNVSILKNNGDGTYQAAVNYGTGDRPLSVFAADLDGDGDSDLAVANYYSDNVSILKNNGDGTYQAAVNYWAGDTPSSVFAVDLDGDGDSDLAVANWDSDNISILKNNGDGSYQAAVNYGAGNSPSSVFAADLDGDGNSDLAVANSYSGNVSILKNNGDGTYQAAVNYGAGYRPSSVFAADLDGDGDSDLAVANSYSGNVSILKNNSDGTYQAAANYGVVDHLLSVFAADLDGDGDNDLATAGVYVLLNNGDGTFQEAVNYAFGGTSVFAADLDGDGDSDLAVANAGSDNVSILKNNGDGTFQEAVNYGTGDRPMSVFAADLDSDGDSDLAVANSSSDNVSILKNNGDGTFQEAVNYAAGGASVFAADLDGDGDNDLATSGVYVLLNNGDGTFQEAVNYAAEGNSVFAADLDGDGDSDLAVANRSSDNVSILKNNGDGTYQVAVNYGAGYQPSSVFAADLDGDGDSDLAVANYYAYNVSILKNNGDGTYQAAVNYGAGSSPLSVFAADLDGDGDSDLAVANFYSGDVSILINLSNVPAAWILSGFVTDVSTGLPMEDVTLTALQDEIEQGSSQSSSNGYYQIGPLSIGSYNVIATKDGFLPDTLYDIEIIESGATANFALIPTSLDPLVVFGFGGGNDNGWDHYGGNCTWTVTGDAYRGYASGLGIVCQSAIGDPAWTDYIFKVDIMGLEGVDKMISFRFSDPDNCYRLNIRSEYQGSRDVILSKTVDGTSEGLTIVPFNNERNQYYEVMVFAFGSRILVYIDGTKIIDYSDIDSPLMNGRVALNIWTGDEGVDHVEFDNVWVARQSTDFGFQPVPDGWRFENPSNMWPESWWSQFENYGYPYTWQECGQPPERDCIPHYKYPDWPLFVEVFGEDQCYIGENIRPDAVKFWRDNAWDYTGGCVGFSATAFLFYDGLILPGYNGDLYDLELTDDTRLLINAYQLRSRGKNFINHWNANKDKTPSQTLSEVRSMLNNEIERRFLCINLPGSGQHAVCPWKIEEDQQNSNVYYIYIYDNNNPGLFGFNNRIKIDVSEDRWWYEDWSLDNELYLSEPVSQYLDPPLMASSKSEFWKRDLDLLTDIGDYFQIYCAPNSDFRLSNPIGEEMGNVGDSLYSNFSDGIHILPFGPFGTSLLGFYVPMDLYQLNATQIADNLFYFDIFSDTVSFYYNRQIIETAETENLSFSVEDKVFELVNADPFDKVFNLESIISKPDSIFVFGVDNCGLFTLDSLRFSVVDLSDLNIRNKGADKIYNLRVERITAEDNSIFVHEFIELTSNFAHRVSPEWSVPALDSVEILIDEGLDGVYEDTIFVGNEYIHPGDNCTNPLSIDVLPFTDIQNNCSYSDDYNLGGKDVVYALTLTEPMNISISLCNTDPVFNTYLLVYPENDCGGTPIATDDNACTDPNPGTSEIVTTLEAGSYYIVIDAYAGECGSYVLNVEEVENIPTLSEWGMTITGLLLLALGTIAVIRRRKVAFVNKH